MTAPTPEQLRTALHKIDTTLGEALERDKIDVPELTACRAAAKRLQAQPSQPLTAEQADYLEKVFPRLEGLAKLGNDYMQRLRQMPQHKSGVILTFPNKEGNGLVSHIKYSYVTVPTTWYDLLRNPFGFGSVEFRDASEAAAKSLGLRFESNFWGTKITIRNPDGTGLSKAQAAEYYQTVGREMDKRGLPTWVGKYEEPATPGLAASASASAGLSPSPSATAGLHASPAAAPTAGLAAAGVPPAAAPTARAPSPTAAGGPIAPPPSPSPGMVPLASPAAPGALLPGSGSLPSPASSAGSDPAGTPRSISPSAAGD